MATSWPSSLPAVSQRDGWEDSVSLGVVAFRPDVGPSITRRRTSYAPDTVRKTWWMTRAQVLTFRAFVRDDLKMGSLPFTYPDELLGEEADFKLVPDDEPSINNLGPDLFEVSVSLQRL